MPFHRQRIERFSIAACILSLITTLAPPAHALDLRKQIEPLARPLIEDGTAVGFMIGLVQQGETQVLAYGETVKGSGVAPGGDTVYEIGSISKVFTCLLLADMVEQGLLKLDDPVQKYLPSGTKMPLLDGQPITLDHLATQTSGLPRMPDNFNPSDQGNPYVDYGDAQMAVFLNGHKLRQPPGKYEYSNLAMGLLGQVLARRAGLSYEQLLIDRITKPLGMNDTRITLDKNLKGRLAAPYNAALKPEKNWDFDAMAGAGAIRSTTLDMLKFVQANLKPDGRSLKGAITLAHRKRHTMDDGMAMGLGWHIARDGITRWHNGMTGGYHAWLAVVPSRDVGVVVLANTATMRITEFGEQVTRVALGAEVTPSPPRKSIAVDPAILASYAGTYEFSPDFQLTVTVEEGKLMVQATGQEKFPVFAESPTKFFYKVVDAQITFEPGKEGRADKLILHQGGRNLEANRRK